ncbi:MAG: hypothetical protein U5M53_14100 [Rhodoferax sp.]|nr:hypothetical protein [Rhodoferax sp.]
MAAWQGRAPGVADVRHWVLSYAILAPHSHNLQSWLVDLSQPDQITLYCDLNRLLPETDPLSRQIMMSQGTFLELLDLAARQRGLRADITLFPQGAFGLITLDQRPTAHIRLTPDASVRPDPLFAQILLRHTNREAYEAREPAASALQAIAASVISQSARVGFVGWRSQINWPSTVPSRMEAWRIELVTPRTIMESYKVAAYRTRRNRAPP